MSPRFTEKECFESIYFMVERRGINEIDSLYTHTQEVKRVIKTGKEVEKE